MLAGHFPTPAESVVLLPNRRTRTFLLYFSSLYRLQKSAEQTGPLHRPPQAFPGGSESLGVRAGVGAAEAGVGGRGGRLLSPAHARPDLGLLGLGLPACWKRACTVSPPPALCNQTPPRPAAPHYFLLGPTQGQVRARNQSLQNSPFLKTVSLRP